jgi:hypothetical protein
LDSDGGLAQVYQPSRSWFPTASSMLPAGRKTPPGPQVAGISVDSIGNVWVFTLVGSPDYAAAWQDVPLDQAGEIRASQLRYALMYHTRVEVLRLLRVNSLHHRTCRTW